MPKLAVFGAKLKCSQGTSPASLSPATTAHVDVGTKATATVDDHQPMKNIPTFGMCRSTSNPQVSAATSAAQGVLTPQPCVPKVSSAWSPGSSSVKIGDVAALTASCTCNCDWAGTIEVSDPGQSSVLEG